MHPAIVLSWRSLRKSGWRPGILQSNGGYYLGREIDFSLKTTTNVRGAVRQTRRGRRTLDNFGPTIYQLFTNYLLSIIHQPTPERSGRCVLWWVCGVFSSVACVVACFVVVEPPSVYVGVFLCFRRGAWVVSKATPSPAADN